MFAGSWSATGGSDGAASPSGDAIRIEGNAKPGDNIVIPDADLLFSGDFKRSGLDLEISHHERHFLVRDYFKGEHRAGLASPDGAWLTGDIVNALTGHTQFAQADGSTSAGKVIGHVTKLAGNATVIRNGVSIVLNLGDNVEKGDVVQSGSDSKLGITFIDGTVFGLASNARMVLNEMVYDPNGSDNSSLISLVAGTITFVAGQTAKHGQMKVDTPVATMGIRGTAVLVEIDFVVPPNGTGPAPTAGFQVLVEPDGTTGSYVLLDKTTQNQIATVDQAGRVVGYSQGSLSFTAAAPLSPEVQQLIADVFALKFTDANPKTLHQFTDSIVPDGIPHVFFASTDGSAPTTLSVQLGLGGVSAFATFDIRGVDYHFNSPPTITATSAEFAVRHSPAHTGGVDAVSGTISFEDVNVSDSPTVSAKFVSFKVLDANGADVTSSLTAKQQAALAGVEANIVIVPSSGNANAGTATWTYSVADRALDFLGAGRTLVLTYQAQIDTNFVGFDTTVFTPFTIKISSPHEVEWIFPGDGLWSVGSNWKTGLVPTALDDAVIPALDTVSSTGHYAVTIAEAAVANSVTLDAFNTSGAELINNSVLTVGDDLTLLNDSLLNNFGSVSAAFLLLHDHSFVQNFGLITLGQGGEFTDQSGFSNNVGATFRLAGGTLNVSVNIANAGLIQIDPAANLTLGGATINGTIANSGVIDLIGAAALIDGPLSNSGLVAVSGSANALHNENVSNFGSIQNTGELFLDLGTVITGGVVSNSGIVRIEGAPGAALHGVDVENFSGTIQIDPTTTTLVVDSGTIINGGTLTIGSVGTLEVTAFSSAALGGGIGVFNSGSIQIDAGATLNLLGATISGGVVSDNGILRVAGDSAINAAAIFGGLITVDSSRTLTLDGTTVANSTVTDNGTVKVDAGNALNLSGVLLSGGLIINLGLIDIIGDSSISSDTMSNNNLTINGGTTLTLNGTLILGGIVADNGTIHVTGNSAINNAAIVGGQIIVDEGFTLTLNGTTVTDTVITNVGMVQIDVNQVRYLDGVALSGGTIDNFGMLEIIGDSSISDDTLNNHQLTIDAGTTLTLSGTIVTGGMVTDNGSIHVIGDSAINSAAVAGGLITVDASTTLTLDNDTVTGTTIADNGTVKIDAGRTLNLNGALLSGGAINNLGLIDIIGNSSIFNDVLSNTQLTIDGGRTLNLSGVLLSGGAISNFGTIDIVGDSSISNDALGNTQLTIDGGKTLTLSGTIVTGGTVTDNGSIHVTGDSAINSAAVNGGQVTVDATRTLTLDNTTVTGTTIFDNGTVKVDGGNTLNLSGVLLSGGAISNFGTIDIIGNSSISNDALSNTQLTIDGGRTLNLSGVLLSGGAISNFGTIDIVGDSSISNDALGNTQLTIDGGKTLTLSGTIVTGGTVTDNGSIHVTGDSAINSAAVNGGQVTVDATRTLTLDNTTVTGTTIFDNGTVKVDGGNTLNLSGVLLSGGAINNLGLIDIIGDSSISNDALSNTQLTIDAFKSLTLQDTTSISGGIVTNKGTLNLQGTSFLRNGTLANTGTVNVQGIDTLNNEIVGNTGAGFIDVTGVLTLNNGSAITNGTGSGGTNAETVELGASLTLQDTTSISGGIVTNKGTLNLQGTSFLRNGTLANTGTVNVQGIDTLNNEIVGNTGAGFIDVTGVLTLNNGSAITNGTGSGGTNAETVELGASLTLQDTTSISGGIVTNKGTLNLQGTSFLRNGTLANTGTVNVQGIDTLNNEIVGNTGAGFIDVTGALTLNNGSAITNGTGSGGTNAETVELGASLTLQDTTSISGGIVTNKGTLNLQGTSFLRNGTLANTGTVNVQGIDTLNNEIVGNTGAGFIDVTGALTLNNGSAITNGTGSGGTNAETVELGASLTLQDTTSISGGIVTNKGTLNLQGTSFLRNGTLANTGTVNVQGIDTLNNEIVGNTGAGFIDVTGALTLNNGSAITNGTGSGGTNAETVELGASLTLQDTTSISGGIVTNKGTLNLQGTSFLRNGTLANTGTVNVQGIDTLNNEIVGNTGAGFIDVTGVLTLNNGSAITNGTGSGGTNAETVELGASLTLQDTTSISGGIVTNKGTLNLQGTSFLRNGTLANTGTVNVQGIDTLNNEIVGNTGAGFIDVTGALTLNNGSAITNGTGSGGTNAETVELGASLTLQDTTSISGGIVTNKGTLNLQGTSFLRNGTLANTGTVNVQGIDTLNNEIVGNTGAGFIDVTGALTLNNGSAITNGTGSGGTNAETVELGASLTLQDTTSISGGIVTNKGTLNLQGTSFLRNGTLANTGTVNVQGIDTLNNEIVGNTGAGFIDVTGVLTLNNGSAITNGTGSGGTNAETVELGASLTLQDTTSISGGIVTNKGTLNLQGTSFLRNGTLANTGTVNVQGIDTLNNEIVGNTGAGFIDVTGALTLNNGSAITNGTGSGGTNAETVELGASLTLQDTTSISGGIVTNKGTLNLQGTSFLRNGTLANTGTVNVQGIDTLNNETVTANHMLEISSGAALLIDQGSTIANGGGTVMVDVGGTLTLDSASLLTAIINGGTVADYGAIYVINTVDISGNIIGTGVINIADLAELEIGGAVASTNTIFLSGDRSELILDHSMQFSGLIAGSSIGTLLTLNDRIDLRDLLFDSTNPSNMTTTVSYNSNVSTVTFIDHKVAGDVSVQIQFSGDYRNQGWEFTNDGSGGSLVQLDPPPVFSDIINNNQYAFTGVKNSPGNVWMFQAAVTDDDANVVGQGGIAKFELYDTHNGVTTLLGSATFAGGIWTVSGIFASVSFLPVGVYTLTTIDTTLINNNDTLQIIAYDAANASASKSVTLKNDSSFNVAPAGIAGDPIDLALTDPSGGQATGPIHVTFTGIPSDWSINEGTNLGNGTWTVETNDLSALTVTTAAGYTGAMVLGVTETWKNADGSTAIAVVSDNVEAYAAGSPIFALSGNDTLTGAGGNDLFVFAQPIGHDTVYTFDTGHDQIDLIGYAGFTSFADIQAHLTEDANGNALITLGGGQSIDLQGAHAAALTQSNFVFDQMPTLDNAGTMTIGDGAVMPLSGTINNTGTIALNSTGDATDLQLIEHGVTLQGGGHIVLSDSDANIISGTSSGVTLDNEDNTISGAGHLGNGELTLTNAGTIDASGTHALMIDTGSNWVSNSGVLEASGSGGLAVASSIANSGMLWANGSTLTVQGQVSGNGTATIDGTATLDLEASATVNVKFGSGDGTLKLGDSFHFNGTITGFDSADTIDLANIEFSAASINYHANAGGTGGMLTISDGAHLAELSLVGDYSADNFSLATDHLKGTSITYLAHDLVV